MLSFELFIVSYAHFIANTDARENMEEKQYPKTEPYSNDINCLSKNLNFTVLVVTGVVPIFSESA